jgi:hypothetical protein
MVQLISEVNLDALGWVKNCLSLVDYYVNVRRDMAAVSDPSSSSIKRHQPTRCFHGSGMPLSGGVRGGAKHQGEAGRGGG